MSVPPLGNGDHDCAGRVPGLSGGLVSISSMDKLRDEKGVVEEGIHSGHNNIKMPGLAMLTWIPHLPGGRSCRALGPTRCLWFEAPRLREEEEFHPVTPPHVLAADSILSLHHMCSLLYVELLTGAGSPILMMSGSSHSSSSSSS